MTDIYATTIRSLDRLILVLSWGTALFSVLRFRQFDSQNASLTAFLLLTLWIGGIAAVMILSRRLLHAEQSLGIRRLLISLNQKRWFRIGNLFWRKVSLWFQRKIYKKYLQPSTQQFWQWLRKNYWDRFSYRFKTFHFQPVVSPETFAQSQKIRSKSERLAKSESLLEKMLFLGPGLLLGLFLVFPSRCLSGTIVYFVVLGIIFSRFEQLRTASEKSDRNSNANGVQNRSSLFAHFSEEQNRDCARAEKPQSLDSRLCGNDGSLCGNSGSLRGNDEFVERDEEQESSEQWDENTLLRLLRTKDENNEEQLQAWMQAEFEKNQRIVNVHLPFFPVPNHVPHLEVLQFQGEEVDIKIAHLSTMGVRIDLKRPARRKTPENVGIFIEMRPEAGDGRQES